MFTGIVQQLGVLASREPGDGDARLAVDLPSAPSGRADIGDSIAVNGVCLTVAARQGQRLLFDVSAETLAVTALDRLEPGARVNLEAALLASDPVGGHFVAGHVDGVGEVVRIEPDGRCHRIDVEAPASLGRYIAVKGCITVDGVSLTVNHVDGARFGFNVVPHTWAATNMQDYRPGTRVHLEVDLIARYLERLMGERDAAPAEPDITTDFLSSQGFTPPATDAAEQDTGGRPDTDPERPD